MTVKEKAIGARKIAQVMIVDDHPALSEGLGHRISAQPDLSVCGQAADVNEALAKLREVRPDIVIVDIALKTSDGLELIKESNPDEVIKAIREILAGRVYLSPTMTSEILGRAASGVVSQADPIDTLTDRKLEIFRLIGEGQSAHDIAQRLHISVHTVETHRENIKRKLNVGTVNELTRRAVLWVLEQT